MIMTEMSLSFYSSENTFLKALCELLSLCVFAVGQAPSEAL